MLETLNLLVWFAMGFAGGAVAVYLINMGLNSDLESEVRFWRETALQNRNTLNAIALICDDFPNTAMAREIREKL